MSDYSKLAQDSIKRLLKRGVSLNDIYKLTSDFLLQHYHFSAKNEQIVKALSIVLKRDEVNDIILTALYMDEAAETMPDSEPLKGRLSRDANGHNVDEILAIGLASQFGAAATVHYGWLDNEKPGLIGVLNDKTDSINVYIDDILAALVASSAMEYLELDDGNKY
ncbi:phosphatidylglycerophosphatase A [Oenococcus oeni]|uniref:phosphatidylglycerophosphatase A family protein n=1 Tax=Oenococcus oeni TaxID=1247 RepID=UPI0008F93615|nr:phosphatidylglycerophosphatase A [Oenococcus oeni]OIK86121.1 phosphatidylglycerophosphatase A [Oenococcus oeni]OIL08712.1 phosphatidylglycerophosphatase A [Oenococcus oeni]OIL12752.1 phosphatidylglycerophosphatase A [Oenococcus oeni]OIM24144.1 phosphatidylglycerophosphatase A [Oenococcus oeni]SYW02244.1 putative Phosphatidylglycerophosphatase A [Oenococcus oeni]